MQNEPGMVKLYDKLQVADSEGPKESNVANEELTIDHPVDPIAEEELLAHDEREELRKLPAFARRVA